MLLIIYDVTFLCKDNFTLLLFNSFIELVNLRNYAQILYIINYAQNCINYNRIWGCNNLVLANGMHYLRLINVPMKL